MNTEKLIDAMVADGPRQSMAVWAVLALCAAAGAAAATALFVPALGVRPDIADALASWRFVAKPVVAALLAGSAFVTAYRLAMPGQDATRAALWLLAPPALLTLAIMAELFSTPPGSWATRALGVNSWVCLQVIPALGLIVLATLLFALRHGAATAPGRAGAAAGLAAGGVAAFLYATHCIDDSPLFVALWYGVGVAVLAAAGAVLGRLVLRW